jgi:hypothetical protein
MAVLFLSDFPSHLLEQLFNQDMAASGAMTRVFEATPPLETTMFLSGPMSVQHLDRLRISTPLQVDGDGDW